MTMIPKCRLMIPGRRCLFSCSIFSPCVFRLFVFFFKAVAVRDRFQCIGSGSLLFRISFFFRGIFFFQEFRVPGIFVVPGIFDPVILPFQDLFLFQEFFYPGIFFFWLFQEFCCSRICLCSRNLVVPGFVDVPGIFGPGIFFVRGIFFGLFQRFLIQDLFLFPGSFCSFEILWRCHEIHPSNLIQPK